MRKTILERQMLFLAVLTTFVALARWSDVGGGESKTANQQVVAIQQQHSDLLAGFTRAVAYSGFRHGQHPDRGSGAINPSDAEILADLQILTRNSNFGLCRLYDSQENSEAVLSVIKANQIEMKVLLGVWLSAEVSNHLGCPWLNGKPIPPATLAANKIKNAVEINNAIRLAREYPEIVVAVNVGNEALVGWTDHLVTVDSVKAYVQKIKAVIRQPVTVAENFAWWAEHGTELADVVDLVMVHTYPVWDGQSIDNALSYSIANIQAVRNTQPESRIIIGEAGWATTATEFGERASEANQQRYVNELTAWAAQMNITTFIFEAFDEDWKGETDNPWGAEKHWGLFTVDRKAKLIMSARYPDLAPVQEKK